MLRYDKMSEPQPAPTPTPAPLPKTTQISAPSPRTAIRPAPTPMRRGRLGAETAGLASKRAGIGATSAEDLGTPVADMTNTTRAAPVTPEQIASLDGQSPFMGSKTQPNSPDAITALLKRYYGRVIDDSLLMEILNSLR